MVGFIIICTGWCNVDLHKYWDSLNSVFCIPEKKKDKKQKKTVPVEETNEGEGEISENKEKPKSDWI